MKGAVLLNPSKDLIKGNPKGVIIMKESALDSWKCADNYTVLPLRQLPINSLEWLQQSKEWMIQWECAQATDKTDNSDSDRKIRMYNK